MKDPSGLIGNRTRNLPRCSCLDGSVFYFNYTLSDGAISSPEGVVFGLGIVVIKAVYEGMLKKEAVTQFKVSCSQLSGGSE